MRIESVTAQGFGPLAGQTLQFAPGLTVIEPPAVEVSISAATPARQGSVLRGGRCDLRVTLFMQLS